ncbi:MAG: hypothetical protein RIS17_768 [Pseudomonadota bacterium]
MKSLVIAAVCAAFALAGCSTTAGAGRDLQSAGKAITMSAEENK